MHIVGIVVGCILAVIIVIFSCAIIECWNESEHLWTYTFGDSLGKQLYEFNMSVNKICWTLYFLSQDCV